MLCCFSKKSNLVKVLSLRCGHLGHFVFLSYTCYVQMRLSGAFHQQSEISYVTSHLITVC